MSLTNAAETALLNLLFNNTDWANIGDAAGLQNSAAPGVFYISLHTANPDETGNQTTSESAYTNYARQSVVRTAAGWTVSGNTVSNAAAITFPACGVTGSTVTYFGIGTDVSGAGNLVASGLLGSGGLVISAGITPSFAIGALTATAD
jgi:hypothetical protein